MFKANNKDTRETSSMLITCLQYEHFETVFPAKEICDNVNF